MKTRTPGMFVIAVLLTAIVSLYGADKKKTAASGKQEKVMQVDSVSVSFIKTNPPQLKIEATGKVNSGGWTKPELKERIHIVPPIDGMYEYDFVATPPSGPATQPILSISAETVRRDVPKGMKGVTVFAAKNSKQAKLEKPSAQKK
jgi:hypothetical protein